MEFTREFVQQFYWDLTYREVHHTGVAAPAALHLYKTLEESRKHVFEV
jgi:hypothetical protein